MKYNKFCANKDCSHLFSFSELTSKNSSYDADKANNNGPVIHITKSGMKILPGAMHHRCIKCGQSNIVIRPDDMDSYVNSVRDILHFYMESDQWVADIIQREYLSKIV